jgi:hypothetical protein
LANKLAQDIGIILSGSMGDLIGQAGLKKNCELIGVTPENLNGSQLPQLAEMADDQAHAESLRGEGKRQRTGSSSTTRTTPAVSAS